MAESVEARRWRSRAARAHGRGDAREVVRVELEVPAPQHHGPTGPRQQV
jgi:hypothetical protein